VAMNLRAGKGEWFRTQHFTCHRTL